MILPTVPPRKLFKPIPRPWRNSSPPNTQLPNVNMKFKDDCNQYTKLYKIHRTSQLHHQLRPLLGRQDCLTCPNQISVSRSDTASVDNIINILNE